MQFELKRWQNQRHTYHLLRPQQNYRLTFRLMSQPTLRASPGSRLESSSNFSGQADYLGQLSLPTSRGLSCMLTAPSGPAGSLGREYASVHCAMKQAFLCSNGHCVDKKAVCNSYDECGDGSDELNCPTKTCASVVACDNLEVCLYAGNW